jgi:hypothetical protein
VQTIITAAAAVTGAAAGVLTVAPGALPPHHGMGAAAAGGHVACSWQPRVSHALASAVAGLRGLQHLHLRFVCGERGYFLAAGLMQAARCVLSMTRWNNTS